MYTTFYESHEPKPTSYTSFARGCEEERHSYRQRWSERLEGCYVYTMCKNVLLNLFNLIPCSRYSVQTEL